MKISRTNTEVNGSESTPTVDKFKYMGSNFEKGSGMWVGVNHRIQSGRGKTEELSGVLCECHIDWL